NLIAISEQPVVQLIQVNANTITATDRRDLDRIVIQPTIYPTIFHASDRHPHELRHLIVADPSLDRKGLFGAAILKGIHKFWPAFTGPRHGGLESRIIAGHWDHRRMAGYLEQFERIVAAEELPGIGIVNVELPRGRRENRQAIVIVREGGRQLSDDPV